MVYFNLQTTQKDSENGNNNKQKQTTSYVKPVLHNYLFFQGSWKQNWDCHLDKLVGKHLQMELS